MIYVVPIGKVDEVLRYSLRSIEKYCSGIDAICIIGNLPEWCINVEFHAINDVSNKHIFRDNNIRVKLDYAIEMYGTIIAGNDDYYYSKEVDLSKLPNYYREIDLQTTIDRHRGGWKQYQNTRDYLVENGKKVRMFDGHCPIIYEKSRFKAVNDANWETPYGYGIKSLYANMNDLEGYLLHDTKIMEGLPPQIVENTIKSSFISSSSTNINKHLLQYLKNEFPYKSKWEK